ncbi:RNA polymerase sigma factor SigJ [Sedimenticola hydrogenitrophicus]|uniref:RNA polymerase sigma factor SigJ n=1 Tax=Sedimenticola hydrogenitrophicus TaxID=2967975 RepID=UPI0021A9727C|nr:RNA polymerase sigma factor SigJ [Sedimenticola hydrogenitrophicus]
MAIDKTQIFEENRRTLEGIAYRMLGTLADARDVVQDTYLKWNEGDAATLRSPRAWLITVCSRKALNLLQSAQRQRETYFGEWLPEPMPAGAGFDLAAKMELDESISIALLFVLEKLSPAERAAWLLHDVFDLGFDEIATILGKTPENCRQLAARARKRVHDGRPRFQTQPEEHRKLLAAFFDAARDGSLAQLTGLLSRNVELYADGGGRAEAVADMLCGAETVGAFFVEVFRKYAAQGVAIRPLPHWFNGLPGLLVFEDEQLATALTLEIDQGRIRRIFAIRNPDKLGAFS